MEFREHVHTTGTALKNWFLAATYDALAVGALWLVGLTMIGVPWALLWAVLGGLLQFVPHIGPVLALVGPSLAVLFTSDDWMRFIYVLILYAVIAVIDGLFLQPYLMKRTSKVPIWASIIAPIVLGIVIPFWGVLLAPPLLAVFYAYKAKRSQSRSPEVIPPPQGSGPGPTFRRPTL